MTIKCFNAAAKTYNHSAVIQSFSANQLLAIIQKNQSESILDIGCGTGLLTQQLSQKYPTAGIIAIDASIDMLHQLSLKNIPNVITRKLDYTNQNIHQKFDIIASNAAIHWMDIKKCLNRISQQLSNNGHAYLAIYGRHTCVELENMLQTINRHQSLPSQSFLTKSQLDQLGHHYFKTWHIQTISKTIHYKSITEMLRIQKETGVHANKPSGLWTPRTIQALEDEFHSTYNRIQLTYEIHLCQATR